VTLELAAFLPVVITLPHARADWEDTGTIEQVARIAARADELGYHHVTCSEHIGIPALEAPRRGSRYWDPLATFGYLAARTERVRLATTVLVLGYHHPLEIAKRYGTLDVISGGRLILGVGVGTLEDEFRLLGAPFDRRGERADDSIRALRASLSKREPSYHGKFWDYDGFVIDPCAIQEHVPIWVGGRTLRSLRRAVALGDGWTPFAVGAGQARDWLAQVEVPDAFEVVLGQDVLLAPTEEPGRVADALGEAVDAGATIFEARIAHTSPEHYLDQLEALAEIRRSL
jgi:probable F420-dependent oxidoreductase